MDKEQYGYSKGLLRYLQESEETIPKGSFVIVQRKGCGYWYFNKSSGKNRLIYLCSVKSRGNEESSFHNSIILIISTIVATMNLMNKELNLVLHFMIAG